MNNKYIVALSFADYLKNKTGMPKAMMAHQQMYNNEQISYVALFSVKKNVLKDRVMLFCKFGLIIDGEYRGIFQMNQILQMLLKWQNEGRTLLDIHLHHLMFVRLSLVDELLGATPKVPIKIYLHDFYNACIGYNLLKNKEYFCGEDGFSKDKCTDCMYYSRGKKIENNIHYLLKKYLNRLLFIAPSESTRRIYLNYHPEYRAQTIVIPHQIYEKVYQKNLEQIKNDEKLRIAYLGMPVRHKGWHEWQKLVKTAPSQEYVFTVFNSSDEQYQDMDKVKLSFSKENMNAMTDCLRCYQVHIALLWSLWPETYSYTCNEAYSSNAFIITNESSGNIADMVRKNQNGLVLSDEGELRRLFDEPHKLKKIVNEYRRSTIGGPDRLVENNLIVEISLQGKQEGKIIYSSRKCVNYPLLYVLNRLYK